MTTRWLRKKIKRYYNFGDLGLIHKSRGKTSPDRWDSEHEKLLIELLQGEWHGFGPTFAAEKLHELYSIKVTGETACKAMIRAHLWKPKQKRIKHRKLRERRAMLGIMIQLDGSPHDWFEGRVAWCTLLVFIDDATSKILCLEFAESESNVSLLQSTWNHIKKYGIPHSFYTDYGSVFHVNLNNPENTKKTQWERAVEQLGVQAHHARSPQAKGRVERCNKTLQDRLVKELRLAGISSIEAANQYLKTSNYIAKHNQKYAVKAQQKGNAHSSAEMYNLNNIFCIRETRVLTNDFTITYNKQIFQLDDQKKTILRPKDQIVVKTHLNGVITLWIRKVKLSFTIVQARPKRYIQEKKIPCYKPCKPSINSRRWAGGLAPLPNSESRVKPALAAVEPSEQKRNFSLCRKPKLFTLV